MQDAYSSAALAGMNAVRSGYSDAVNRGKAWFDACLLSYANVLGFADTDPQRIVQRLYQNFIDNSKWIKSRNFTFGAVSAGGANVGNGTINRLVIDANTLEPMITYGTNPGMGLPISGVIPDPANESDPAAAREQMAHHGELFAQFKAIREREGATIQ